MVVLVLDGRDSLVGEAESISDAGDSTALPVRLERSAAPAKDEGGELLRPVEDDMKPKALRAEKRLLLEKPAPKLVRRGGCDKRAFVTGCGASELSFDEELEKKNCGRRNELLRCGCDAGCWCSGEERPEDEAMDDEDGEVEYILNVVRDGLAGVACVSECILIRLSIADAECAEVIRVRGGRRGGGRSDDRR